MSPFVRWLIGTALFVVLMLAGYALGIRPSFAEIMLTCVALGISKGLEEALK